MTRLNTWGIAVLLGALLLGVALCLEAEGEKMLTRIGLTVLTVGPLIIAGCVLIVGGLIVDAIRERG